MEVADPGEAAAAEGRVVVLLDITRDDGLRMEGDARDLNRVIQDLRKRARLRYSDRIVLSISGSGLEPSPGCVWSVAHGAGTGRGLTTTQLPDPLASGSVRLGSGSTDVAIALAVSDLC